MAFCFVYTCAKLVYAFNRPLTFKARLSVKPLSVFSLNFSSAGKGQFMASQGKDMHQSHTFLGEGSSGVRDMALPSLGKLGAKFFEMLFSHFKTYFTQIGIVIFRQQFAFFVKLQIPIIFLCLQCSLSKCMVHKKESCVDFSTFPYSFISP